MKSSISTRVLGATDVLAMRDLLEIFGTAFDDHETYSDRQPDDLYLRNLLSSPTFIAVAAQSESKVIGGLTGYVLTKFEQARSEIYIYDIAVAEDHRRRGVATALIEALKAVAAQRGVYVVFVQADFGDDPAIALYSQLGTRLDVVHFEINPSTGTAQDLLWKNATVPQVRSQVKPACLLRSGSSREQFRHLQPLTWLQWSKTLSLKIAVMFRIRLPFEALEDRRVCALVIGPDAG